MKRTWILGCSSMTKSSQTVFLMKYLLCLHVRGPPKKFQILISIFVRSLHTFVIGSFYKAKTTRKQVKMTILSEMGLSMIDLVLTHLDHCWGPPWWFGALKSVPVIHFGRFRHAWKWTFGGKLVIFKHVAKGRQGAPRVAKVQGGPRGWLRWVRTKSIIFKPFSDMICTI